MPMKLAQIFERQMTADSSFIRSKIYDNYDLLIESKNINQLVSNLNVTFKQDRIRFKNVPTAPSKYIEDSMTALGIFAAWCYSTGTIIVHVNDRLVDTFTQESNLETAINFLTSIIKHELIHREQYLKSNGKLEVQKSYKNKMAKAYSVKTYAQHVSPLKTKRSAFRQRKQHARLLSDPHEIYAMAHEIVDELKSKKIPIEKIIAALRRKSDSDLLRKSNRFAFISDTFLEYDPLKIIPRIKKTIYQVLQIKPKPIKQ